MTNRNRQPAGQPTGGQFAPTHKAGADVSLAQPHEGARAHVGGVDARIAERDYGRAIELSGSNPDLAVDAYLPNDITPYPDHLPGTVEDIRLGWAKHHNGEAVTITIKADSGENRSYTFENMSGDDEDDYFEFNPYASDPLPEMSDAQEEEFHEWASTTSLGVSATISDVRYGAAATHVSAATQVLTKLLQGEK